MDSRLDYLVCDRMRSAREWEWMREKTCEDWALGSLRLKVLQDVENLAKETRHSGHWRSRRDMRRVSSPGSLARNVFQGRRYHIGQVLMASQIGWGQIHDHQGHMGMGHLLSVWLLVSPQVMISWFVGSSPRSGSMLTVWSLLRILSMPPSVSYPPLLTLPYFQNEYIHFKKY